MQDILRFMTLFTQSSTINQQNKENVISTQTEISAVHTPQVFYCLFYYNSMLQTNVTLYQILIGRGCQVISVPKAITSIISTTAGKSKECHK